jgi:hypothetical protein
MISAAPPRAIAAATPSSSEETVGADGAVRLSVCSRVAGKATIRSTSTVISAIPTAAGRLQRIAAASPRRTPPPPPRSASERPGARLELATIAAGAANSEASAAPIPIEVRYPTRKATSDTRAAVATSDAIRTTIAAARPIAAAAASTARRNTGRVRKAASRSTAGSASRSRRRS